MFMFICRLSPKKKRSYMELEFIKLEFLTRYSSSPSLSTVQININIILFIKGTRVWYTPVLCCMELEFTKLEYHIIFF